MYLSVVYISLQEADLLFNVWIHTHLWYMLTLCCKYINQFH